MEGGWWLDQPSQSVLGAIKRLPSWVEPTTRTPSGKPTKTPTVHKIVATVQGKRDSASQLSHMRGDSSGGCRLEVRLNW